MRKVSVLSIIFICIIIMVGCGRTQPISRYDFCLDTICTVTVYDKTDEGILDESFELIKHYESLLSSTVSTSDIYRINHAGGEAVQVSKETAELLNKALKYCELTDGIFDITIYPVSSLWDFKSDEHILPDEGKLSEALKHVDYKNIEINGDRVRLKDPKAGIEPGAIAKGYIADKLCGFLKEKGVSSAIINLGGNVSVIGDKNGEPFKIGIKKPFSDTGEVLTTFDIKDRSVVTSGLDERYFQMGDTIYHHILDTKTGYPADTGIKQVSVIADNSTDADALSTILFLYGPEKSGEFLLQLKNDNIKFVFVDKDNQMISLPD